MNQLLVAISYLFLLTAAKTITTPPPPSNPSCNSTLLLQLLPSTLPTVHNTTILSLSAHPVHNHPSLALINPPLSYPSSSKISFCNITLIYTHIHPSLNDGITLTLHLPLSASSWNENFLAQGGGGYKAGDPGQLAPLVSLGYAAASTDAGRSIYGSVQDTIFSSEKWSLNERGEVNTVLLENFADRSLWEMGVLGKLLTKVYYGEEARWSYWHGCSTGGRQGMMVAQRFPGLFDGVLAGAPAINWSTLLVGEVWGQVVMNALGYWPEKCELGFITGEAVRECDELDGVVDGVVGAPGLCGFDARSVVGRRFDCEGEERRVSREAVEVMNAAWRGPVDGDGRALWFGLTHETELFNSGTGKGLASTICSSPKNCTGDPFPISADWIRQFILKDPSIPISSITPTSFLSILQTSQQEYGSLMDTSNPDLRPFQARGGKIISWHGLADKVLPPNNTLNYYKRVEAISPDIRDFYRYFEAPGVAHCAGGKGPFPLKAFESLVKWVEEGVAPDVLDTQSMPVASEGEEVVYRRPLCPWPKVAAYRGNGRDPAKADSFTCRDGFGEPEKGHDEL